jgi:hypothetical protein
LAVSLVPFPPFPGGAEELKRAPRQGDVVPLGPIALVAHRIADGRVARVGLRLADDDAVPTTLATRLKKVARDLWALWG